ncbi:unnamed protein product [Rhizoctonia solani]|uniref:Uncharacterized protein n=1 Tax=Rhizoctonia solani TaxID=456999 RepID=A0A8H3CR21_9AGAM|nr:unnamed protein product [Rhizoctonia solani]
MDKRGNGFLPAGTGPPLPPTMDFAFTNPNANQSRGTPTPRGYFSENRLDRSKYVHDSDDSDELVFTDLPVSYGQVAPKKLKPGPISRSELSSGTNAFNLRAENITSTQNSSSSTRLRQEVFKKPHTLAPPPRNFDVAPSGRFAPAPGPSTIGDAVLKVSNKQVEHIRTASSSVAPSPSPFLKSEVLASPDVAHTPGGITAGQRRRVSLADKSRLLSRSTTLSLIEEPSADSGDLLSRTAMFPLVHDASRVESRYQTPSRESVVPTTPSSEKSTREDISNIRDLKRKCQLYEVDQKFDRDLIASQSQTIEELSNKNSQMEEKARNLESKYATEVKEIIQRADDSLAKLTDIHEKISQTSAGQIKELKQNLVSFRQEIRDSMNAVEPLLAGHDEMKSTLREIAEELEQQILKHNDEKTRLQQTNDLLQDQLSDRTGNYTESLEREKELQTSLITLGESHANVAKALSALHEQYNQINTKYVESKLSENTATKRVGELEGALDDLKTDNVRMNLLLADNEQAFSRKLQALEEDSDGMRSSLESAHEELSASKSSEQAAHSQAQALLQEKAVLSQNNTLLERNLELKSQLLNEARDRNEDLERKLNDERRSLEDVHSEKGQIMGQLVEKDRVTSAQIRDLNTALESSREREGSLTSEIATLNALVSTLRERTKAVDEVVAEHRALERALSEKRADIERVDVENGQLQSQVVQLELARDALNEEVKQLREASYTARERETASQKELHGVRQSLKEHRDASEKTRISVARVEAAMDQVKVALEKEKDAHRITEKQREAMLLSLNKLQVEQKTVLDKTSATEKKLRSSLGESQERIKMLELEHAEQENELKRLRHELNASNSAKAALESLITEFRNSVQQARSQREKIETQESKLVTLGNQVSSQKTELRMLEQQLSHADARLVESKTDANAHRAAAESARASAAAIEVQLKQKEQEIEAIRAGLQPNQCSHVDVTADIGPTSLLQIKVAEQEDAIKDLKSQISELERSSGSIVERYKGGNLTNPEKDLVGVITAGIVQEKNRTINNLKGELKRKENDNETHKATIANLKDSLAKQIKQTAELKGRLDSNGEKDPAGWQSFNHQQMTISSSPLSDPGRYASDHDPPAPDSPTVQLAERPGQGSRYHEQPQQHNPGRSARPMIQQNRAPVPTRLESGNAMDDIQEFEEPVTPHGTGTTGRKRAIVGIEPLDDEDQEEHEHETRRKTRMKAKKDNKVVGESSGTKGQPNKTDGSSTSTKGKATKRRKV